MFEWDEEKNRKNIEKHGISFEQAQGIFAGPVVSVVDARDYGEERVISLGMLRPRFITDRVPGRGVGALAPGGLGRRVRRGQRRA